MGGGGGGMCAPVPLHCAYGDGWAVVYLCRRNSNARTNYKIQASKRISKWQKESDHHDDKQCSLS